MDQMRHRPERWDRAHEHERPTPPASDRRRGEPDQYRHTPGSAAAQWRTEGLDFVRDAINRTFK
jgi:hypothetical protein